LAPLEEEAIEERQVLSSEQTDLADEIGETPDGESASRKTDENDLVFL
jgi:hypothetical protein